MKSALRVLLGAVVGTLVLWAALYLLGLLAVWSPWPDPWWAHRYTVVAITSKAIAFLPCVALLGLFFAKLFPSRPALYAMVTMTLVLVVACADTLLHPELIGATLRLTWEMLVVFLLGPPIVVYLLGSLRSNNRWSGP
jgi:hypothetical protein